jgi:uncharacterized protein YjbI with pentapeptide repeats
MLSQEIRRLRKALTINDIYGRLWGGAQTLDFRRKRRKRLLPTLGAITLLIGVMVAVWKIPQWQYASWRASVEGHSGELKAEDRLRLGNDIRKLENDSRTILVQGLGGFALLIGLLFTWRNLRITEQSSRRTLELSQEGQITDRFTKAIEQLGAVDQEGRKKFAVRLGGIYALERIAKESAEDHWAIMEILTAYIRDNAVRKESAPETNQTPLTPDTDVQAIVDVLGRCARTFGKKEMLQELLNLMRVDLRGADFRKAVMGRADFGGSRLHQAHFGGADLREARFIQADLSGARFTQIEGAFAEGELHGVDLGGANIQAANLSFANVEHADFRGANLSKTWFSMANLHTADLRYANLTDAYLGDVQLAGALLCEADLRGTNFYRANLYRADLTGARNLTAEQLASAKTLFEAEMDSSLLQQIQQRYPALLETPKFDPDPAR